MVHLIAQHFDIPDPVTSIQPHGSGHIHETFVAQSNNERYILQKMNQRVFPDVDALMENVSRVIEHLRDKTAHALSLVRARDGRTYYRADDGSVWRCYPLIENARSYDAPESPEMAREAARAFGAFQQMLMDFPPPRLHEVIPDFHHTPKRQVALEQAIERDPMNRAAAARTEIDCALTRRDMVSTLVDGPFPERIAHNDAKLNNVLMDERTGRARCIIDLDTVMPGWSLCDFGDLVRTASCRAAEDERDLARVTVDLELYEALADGYVSVARDFLVEQEIDHMVRAGMLITLETGIRFLTDHLLGDTYFTTHRPNHNLDRCRAQFALVADMEKQETQLERIVQRHVPR